MADTVICLDGEGGIAACCSPLQLAGQLKDHMSRVRSEMDESDSKLNWHDGDGKDLSKTLSSRNIFGFFELLSSLDMSRMHSLEEESKEEENRVFNLASKEDEDNGISDKIDSHNTRDVILLVDKEGRGTGGVGLIIYWFYLQACGGLLAAFCLIFMNISVSMLWFTNSYTLGEWMQVIEMHESSHKQAQSLFFYLLSVVACLGSVACLNLSKAICALKGSHVIHDRLLGCVLRATLAWHDSQPTGRKVNRFSQDVSTLDADVMNNLQDFIDCLVSTAQVVLVITILVPSLIPFLTPVILYNYWVSNRYIRASRELKRLESVNKSPIFVLFSETLTGLSVIRAFRHESRFFELCCKYMDVANR
jgi:ABC-type multidrug transport system fused ATPase/permease subunit